MTTEFEFKPRAKSLGSRWYVASREQYGVIERLETSDRGDATKYEFLLDDGTHFATIDSNLEPERPAVPDSDPINHPSHYADGWSNGAEVIDITENLNFNRGNAVKYLARAGVKDPTHEIEDLKKARWYVERELNRLKAS